MNIRTVSATRLRAATAATAVLLALGVAQAGAAGHALTVPNVTVRVESPTATLLPPTVVTLHSTPVTLDGRAADRCSGLSALGALDDAIRGDLAGTWSKSYNGYFVTRIGNVAYTASSPYYWSFWLNYKPSNAGACAVDPKAGSSVLFFAQYDGPNKQLSAPSVLGVTGPSAALIGKPFTLTVSSYTNANGKRSPASGATLTASHGVHATTSSTGTATLTETAPGLSTIDITAPNSIRTVTTVCIHAPGKTCK